MLAPSVRSFHLKTNSVPLMIFDGDCSFCTSSANWAVKHSKVAVTATPWQFLDLSKFGLTEADTAVKAYLVVDGKNYGGSDCFAMMCRIQKNPFAKLLGWIMMFWAFRWVFAIGYRIVAKNRHRMPGGTPACAMPPQKPSN